MTSSLSRNERLQAAMEGMLKAIQEIPPKANEFKLLNAYDAVLSAISSENATPQVPDGRSAK